jgi:hypothetical protein
VAIAAVAVAVAVVVVVAVAVMVVAQAGLRLGPLSTWASRSYFDRNILRVADGAVVVCLLVPLDHADWCSR